MGLALEAVSKYYGSHRALDAVSLEVADGEFLTLLGPSGSGKTTILRLVGGFTRPTAGRIRFGGVDVTAVPTHKRPFNTVFQDYALFPHLTVAGNVGYGLMVRGRPKAEIRRKVEETLEIVGLSGLLGRYPAELSGGQKQRVALARAIVCEPRLILLDEPLAALDANLRRQMQFFLKSLQRRIATTFLFVTHDQEEAITLSDRIVVMDHGRVEQVGTPREIYYAPRTAFVAGFFGDNNLLEGRLTAAGAVETALGRLAVPGATVPGERPVLLAVRPERIGLNGAAAGAVGVPARVGEVVFVGPTTHVVLNPLAAPHLALTAKLPSGEPGPSPGSEVTAWIAPGDLALVERCP